MPSIHSDGKVVLDEFRALAWPAEAQLTFGPRAGRNAKSVPDCTIDFGDGSAPVPIELKRSSTSVAQLRALEYHVLVVWNAAGNWWVVPAEDVLLLVSLYAGQHTVNSFECCNPGKPSSPLWDRWKTAPGDVPARVKAAQLSREASPLKLVTDRFRKQISELYEQQKAELKHLLAPA